MRFVEPIRKLKQIELIKNNLRGRKSRNAIRDLLLFHLGITSALRISDLLEIKTGDLFNDESNPKKSFEVNETKTDKKNITVINPKLRETLLEFKTAYPAIIANRNAYVFFHSKQSPIGAKNIDRRQAWIMIANWCKNAGLTGSFGGHTLRKTWGYQARKNNNPLEIIQFKLNHSSLSTTKRYLGITDDEIAEACYKMDL